MQVEVGKRYLLARYDGLPNIEAIAHADEFGSLFFRPDGTVSNYTLDPNGGCFGIGSLRELTPVVGPLRPIFGHYETEFERLQRVFRDWDFSFGSSG